MTTIYRKSNQSGKYLMWTYCITRVCIKLWRLSAILFFCWISPPFPGQIYVFVWPQYMYIRWSRIFIGNFSLIENVLEFRNWWSLDQKFPKKPSKKWCIRKVTHFGNFVEPKMCHFLVRQCILKSHQTSKIWFSIFNWRLQVKAYL